MAEEKQKRVTLSIEQKFTILKKITVGATLLKISKEYWHWQINCK